MLTFFAGTAAGLCGALGMGSGTALLLCLSLMGADPLFARSVSLLFFPLTGGFSLLLHHRRGLAAWDIARPLLPWGILGAAAGSLAAEYFPVPWFRRICGLFLLYLGADQLRLCLCRKPSCINPPQNGQTDSGMSS